MSIDIETAAHVAKLARIKVEQEDLPELAAAFNTIIGFVEQLNEVDVEGVEPMTSVTPMRLKRRKDEVTDGVHVIPGQGHTVSATSEALGLAFLRSCGCR